jgi:hypothetical protein
MNCIAHHGSRWVKMTVSSGPCVAGDSLSPSSKETEQNALAPDFRLLKFGGGNRPVESGPQLLGRPQR